MPGSRGAASPDQGRSTQNALHSGLFPSSAVQSSCCLSSAFVRHGRRPDFLYGSDVVDEDRRAANYLDCVLKDEKPVDLPVQVPTRYGYVVNLKTAKSSEATVP